MDNRIDKRIDRAAHAVALLLGLFLSNVALGQTASPAWRSGFESGFPGEFLDYDDGSYTQSGGPNPGKNEAWTIVDVNDFAHIYAGNYVYKGWITGAAADSHRAYPVIHTEIPTPAVNSFMVWLQWDTSQLDEYEWVHFGTWANNPDWDVHTMAVLANGMLEMAHLDYSYIGPSPQQPFPLEQWVRLTIYLDYENNGYVRVWQDGVAIFEGNFHNHNDPLMRAHWGMYASGPVDNGVQYNDEIQIWTLDSPLADVDTEPASPYEVVPEAGTSGGAGSGGSGGAGGSAGDSSAGSGGEAGSAGGSGIGQAGQSGSSSGASGSTGGATTGPDPEGGASGDETITVSAGQGATGEAGAGDKEATVPEGQMTSDGEESKARSRDSGCSVTWQSEPDSLWVLLLLSLALSIWRRRAAYGSKHCCPK